MELLNMLFLYYFFVFAILVSDVLFFLSLFNVIQIRALGPYAELWAVAFLLFVLEVMVALSFEREDSRLAPFLVVLAYLTYTKLWVLVVFLGFYADFIQRKKRIWAKTERFDFDAEKVPSRDKP
jgi:hypothetical protein